MKESKQEPTEIGKSYAQVIPFDNLGNFITKIDNPPSVLTDSGLFLCNKDSILLNYSASSDVQWGQRVALMSISVQQ